MMKKKKRKTTQIVQYISPGMNDMHVWVSTYILGKPYCCPTKTKILLKYWFKDSYVVKLSFLPIPLV